MELPSPCFMPPPKVSNDLVNFAANIARSFKTARLQLGILARVDLMRVTLPSWERWRDFHLASFCWILSSSGWKNSFFLFIFLNSILRYLDGLRHYSLLVYCKPSFLLHFTIRTNKQVKLRKINFHTWKQVEFIMNGFQFSTCLNVGSKENITVINK